MRSYGIAAATWMETVRQLVFWLLLATGSVLLFGAPWITLFGFGEEGRMVLETGVSGAVMGGILLVFLTVPGAVAEEIRTRQILAILAKPISGFGVVLGKFLGLAGALAALFAVYYVAFGGSVLWRWGGVSWGSLLAAYYLGFLQAAVVGSVVLLFSVLLPVPVAVGGGFAVFAAGNLLSYLQKLLEGLGEAGRWGGKFLLLWLPDLMRLNASFDYAEGRTPSIIYLSMATLYSGSYVLLTLSTAGFALSRKEVA